MYKASYKHILFPFIKPAGTSRGVLLHKSSWFIQVWDDNNPHLQGIGECSLIPELSPDSQELIEIELQDLYRKIHNFSAWKEARGHLFPAIQFAMETALADLSAGGNKVFGETAFSRGQQGISINGLIWMGSRKEMQQQIASKIEAGFSTIKIKVGALEFDQECELLKYIRNEFCSHTIEIRLDANGAFLPGEAAEKLHRLSQFHIHSIEQPIKAGQPEIMAALCDKSPIPIALDKELIGITQHSDRLDLLKIIQPRFIILKPSLLGGLEATLQWAQLAQSLNLGWWVTSALESNIGLNAIAQWTFDNAPHIHQGLGTGQLFVNNFDSPLEIYQGKLFHNPQKKWNLNALL